METRTSPPLPERIALLWQEARWLLLCAMAIYLALILGSFSPADPGWSHAETTSVILNAGGRLGAWLSDLLLYLFGLSAWWLVLLMLSGIMWGYRRLDNLITLPRGDRRPAVRDCWPRRHPSRPRAGHPVGHAHDLRRVPPDPGHPRR